jgi:hypothetical protein
MVPTSFDQLSESARLILMNIPPVERQELITIHISRALTLSQFYHMKILEKTIFIGALIQSVDVLSELKSLKIHSLSLDQPRKLCEEEVDIFLSTEDTSNNIKSLSWSDDENSRNLFSDETLSLHGISQNTLCA